MVVELVEVVLCKVEVVLCKVEVVELDACDVDVLVAVGTEMMAEVDVTEDDW